MTAITAIEIARAVLIHGPSVVTAIEELMLLGNNTPTPADFDRIRARVNNSLTQRIEDAELKND